MFDNKRRPAIFMQCKIWHIALVWAVLSLVLGAGEEISWGASLMINR